MLAFAEVSLGAGGVVACRRCAPSPPASYRETAEILADIDAAVRARRGVGALNVSLSGAEPFNHPDLPEVVSFAVEAGADRVRIETDASALASESNAAGSLAAGVRHMRVRLLGGAGVHNDLSGRQGLFEEALEGVEVYRRAAERASVKVFLSAVVPVGPHNLRGLSDLIAELAGDGFGETVLRISPALDATESAPWVAAACDTGTVNRMWVSVEGMPQQALGEHRVHATVLWSEAALR